MHAVFGSQHNNNMSRSCRFFNQDYFERGGCGSAEFESRDVMVTQLDKYYVDRQTLCGQANIMDTKIVDMDDPARVTKFTPRPRPVPPLTRPAASRHKALQPVPRVSTGPGLMPNRANKTHNAIPFTKGMKSTPAVLTSSTKLSDHPYLKRPAKRTTELEE
ncbi:hypothetical protein YC2023_050313 [Brassica napus]